MAVPPPSLDLDLLRSLAVTVPDQSDSTSSNRDIWETNEALLAGTEYPRLNLAVCAAARYHSMEVDYCQCVYEQRYDHLRTEKILGAPEFVKAWLGEGPSVELPGIGKCYPVESFDAEENSKIMAARCPWCQKGILHLVPQSLIRDHAETNLCLPRESCARTRKNLGIVAIEGYLGWRGWAEWDGSVGILEAIERAWPGDMSRGLMGRLEADSKWYDVSSYCVKCKVGPKDSSDPVDRFAARCFTTRKDTSRQTNDWASRRLREGLAKHRSGGSLDDALLYYDSALELNPRHPDALVAKGAALTTKGSYGRAVQCFDEALRVKPSHGNARRYREIALKRSGMKSVGSSSGCRSVISLEDDSESEGCERRRHKHHHHRKKRRA
ncbi:Tetratricopeptide repeat protein 14 [Perkinsus olseni]|uniref:Tetratricopeptide repeat protein 14 n=1 Tax=Perkinsus olseni TaxID=32597 RepID=A0A7J6P2Y4_PEROL|nr:Tetratricopeptide repeat protein 14 [Perkinsus olseni]